MKTPRIPTILTMVLLFATTVFANEPLWTPQERAEQRSAVIRGTVLRVTKLKALNDREDLMSAEIRVDQVLKKADELPEKTVTVFYAASPRGTGSRCPTYAVLAPDQAATFYLSYGKELTAKGDFVIAMGSDVIAQGEPATRPEAKEKSPIRSPETGNDATPEQVEAAKAQGAETAAADIKAGVYRILYYGKPYPLKPLVDEATGYRVQIVGGCIVTKTFVAEANAYNQATRDWYAKNPQPHIWPPPLDEKRLIGTWVRINEPIKGEENHTLLVLREDHTWNEVEITGPLTAPVRIKNFAPDSTWELVNLSETNLQTMLLFKHKERGSNSWNISKVGVAEIDFASWGGAITMFQHYTRCEEPTATKLNEMLKIVVPGASSR